MIDINSLTEKDIGKVVNYFGGVDEEWGIIKSWNDKFIFVQYFLRVETLSNGYNLVRERTGETAEGALPHNLEFVFPWQEPKRAEPESENPSDHGC